MTPVVEIWPDNAVTVNVFIAMSTQWRAGMGGATGLDYGVLPFVMRMMAVPPADRAEVFEGVRAMEDSALATMGENRK